MLFTLRRDDRDVLAQIAFVQQQCVAGGAAAASFVTFIACFGRFDRSTLFLAEWRVDAAIRLRRGGGGANQKSDECEARAATEGRPYSCIRSRDINCRGGPPWPPVAGCLASWFQQGWFSVNRDCPRVCGRCSRRRPPSTRCRSRARLSLVRDRRCLCLSSRQTGCALRRQSWES